jgi:hypothetical protein
VGFLQCNFAHQSPQIDFPGNEHEHTISSFGRKAVLDSGLHLEKPFPKAGQTGVDSRNRQNSSDLPMEVSQQCLNVKELFLELYVQEKISNVL